MSNTIRISTAVLTVFFAAGPVLALDASVQTDADARVALPGAKIQAAASTKVEARVEKGKERADQEIDRRISALTSLKTRIASMVRLTMDQKNSLSASIASEITALETLNAKIAADTDIETLKIDIKSITNSYRIFLLVIPQGHITVAADKLKNAAQKAGELQIKLAARIDSALSAGHEVTALKTSLTNMQAKISLALAKADAAVTAVTGLTPDNGDQTKAKTNQEALKAGRTDIKEGTQALVDARQEIRVILQGLHALEGGAAASTTVQATSTH